MFKKTLSIHTLAAMMLMGGLAFTQMSCSQEQQKEVSQESNNAYDDFKGFVDQTEMKATNVANETEADYERETAQMKADFDSKVAAIDREASTYDDQRRQEVEDLRNRYTTAYDKREATWRTRDTTAMATANNASGSMDSNTANTVDYSTTGKYYTPTKSYSNISAATLPAVYQRFTADIKKNEDNYDIADWRNINADWKRLNARKDELDPTLSSSAKTEIAKQKVEYAAMKSYDKSEARVEQGADAVSSTAKNVAQDAKSTGKDVGQAVGNKAENVAQDAKSTGKDVGHAVGNTAKDVGHAVGNTAEDVGQGAANVGKDAYKGAKKGVKKVGNAVDNVFDGKDKNN